MIDNLVRKNVTTLEPYKSARSLYTSGIFFDANENALGSTVELEGIELNRYPDPKSSELRSAIAEYVGVSPGNIFVGNGSDEAIDLLIRVFVEQGEDVVIIDPTYGMYKVAADSAGVATRSWPLTEDFNLDLASFEKISKGAKIVFCCSPNNPTGNSLKFEDIKTLCRDFKGLVVVDEAYVEFASKPSIAKKVLEIENLVILRTFSKAWGLAGIRVGYAVADERVIEFLDKIKAPYNLNRVSATLAIKALQNKEKMLAMRELILGERERVATRLRAMNLRVYDSEGNYLLVQLPNAPEVVKNLAEKEGLVIRNFGSNTRLKNCARITIGKPEENDRLLEAIKKML